ncbi:LysR family transcriptional regulator [Rhizobium sp. S163]|uniref:LysR family transcriptional regulator n=1 Tax=Rhizobium sp. S163 TaxID=3055039 RepID=UPI0025A93484|nr:LysR family transcriptional regulator [Rhizobium sp. S163]MDM9645447.1 LysR family transcriptional regulator [Rhizobium sp. S163]
MNTEDVRIFVAASAAGSLSEAARRLGIAPMVATRRLASLEAALDVRLMHRTTRSLSLTPEGETFLPFAQALVENEEEARARLRTDGKGAAGLLRVSVPVAFGLKLVMPLVPKLLQDNPDFKISVDMNDSLPDLVASGTDLAIRIARLKDSSLIAQKLADNARSLVAAPAYLKRRGAPMNTHDLLEHDCLPMTGVSHWTFMRGGIRGDVREDGETHVRLNSRFSSSSIAGCHAACLAGGGLALLSNWYVEDDIDAGRLVRITLEDAVPETNAIWAVYPTTRLILPKVRVFISAIRSTLAEPPP